MQKNKFFHADLEAVCNSAAKKLAALAMVAAVGSTSFVGSDCKFTAIAQMDNNNNNSGGDGPMCDNDDDDDDDDDEPMCDNNDDGDDDETMCADDDDDDDDEDHDGWCECGSGRDVSSTNREYTLGWDHAAEQASATGVWFWCRGCNKRIAVPWNSYVNHQCKTGVVRFPNEKDRWGCGFVFRCADCGMLDALTWDVRGIHPHACPGRMSAAGTPTAQMHGFGARRTTPVSYTDTDGSLVVERLPGIPAANPLEETCEHCGKGFVPEGFTMELPGMTDKGNAGGAKGRRKQCRPGSGGEQSQTASGGEQSQTASGGEQSRPASGGDAYVRETHITHAAGDLFVTYEEDDYKVRRGENGFLEPTDPISGWPLTYVLAHRKTPVPAAPTQGQSGAMLSQTTPASLERLDRRSGSQLSAPLVASQPMRTTASGATGTPPPPLCGASPRSQSAVGSSSCRTNAFGGSASSSSSSSSSSRRCVSPSSSSSSGYSASCSSSSNTAPVGTSLQLPTGTSLATGNTTAQAVINFLRALNGTALDKVLAAFNFRRSGN